MPQRDVVDQIELAQPVHRIPMPDPEDDEHIEEVVRQYNSHRGSVEHVRLQPRTRRTPVCVRRHIHIDKVTGTSYQMLELSTRESRRSMDGSEASSSSAVTMATSATSTGTDPWSTSGFVEEEQDDADRAVIDWDDEDAAENDDELLVPKIEPVEDTSMEDYSPQSERKESNEPETPTADQPGSATTTPLAAAKRPRGRPRKHPKPTLESQSKVAKGRSKTGCITCRKRKKKCDETKPSCMNCEKNSVKCEGYPEKTIWKSGREKAEEGRIVATIIDQQGAVELTNATVRVRRASNITLTSMQLPILIHGLETEGDRIFLHHYVSRLSVKFTLEGNENNSFRNIMLPMAQQHSGLMHSILALSSKHLDYTSPYGLQILHNHPSVGVQELQERSQYHKDEALKELMSVQRGEKVEHTTYAQMICLVLETLSDPAPNGQHRFHLQHYQRLIQEDPPSNDDEPMKFIHEFFQYHIGADQLIHLPLQSSESTPFGSSIDNWNLPGTVLQPSAVRLLGVFDGLFLYMSKITNIRNSIRRNIELGIDPIVDYQILYSASEIDAGIREWTPVWPSGDPRDAAGFLYKQMMWIYLWRTIYPPQTTNWKLHPAITTAVNGGIELLSQIPSRDPSQTLALAPAFVIGCAAFDERQREPIRKAIATVKDYMEYRNTDTALEVLEEVWRLMDARDERSWDWQSIAKRMGMDFLAT